MAGETELQHPKLQRLLDFWRERRGAYGVPISDSLDPGELRSWITNLLVMDVSAGGDFTYSYYGGAFATAFNTDMVGKSIDLLPAEQRAALRAEYDRARGARQPQIRRYTANFDGAIQTWERLTLPLSTTGDGVDKILVAAYRIDPPDNDGDGEAAMFSGGAI